MRRSSAALDRWPLCSIGLFRGPVSPIFILAVVSKWWLSSQSESARSTSTCWRRIRQFSLLLFRVASEKGYRWGWALALGPHGGRPSEAETQALCGRTTLRWSGDANRRPLAGGDRDAIASPPGRLLRLPFAAMNRWATRRGALS